MPRSSRHKSSKHGSKEVKDYSDSEKDSSLKERKSREGSVSHRGSKESASGEKRKYDLKSAESKELMRSGNVDFVEEHGGSSSKKRREKVDDDRWTGEVDDPELMKPDKDSKGFSDSKGRSSRRDEKSGLDVNMDEGKRSGNKVESKHHRSERKERGEKEGSNRDRKSKDYSKSERFADGEAEADGMGGEGSRKHLGDERNGYNVAGNTEINAQDNLWNAESEREGERRVRRKRDSVGDMDKYQDGSCELDDKRTSSKDEVVKSVKYKESGYKDDKHKDKYRDEVDKDLYQPEEKQYISSRSDDKHSSSRIEKKDHDMQTRKLKLHDAERENERGRYFRHHEDNDRDDRDHDGDRDREGDRIRGREDDRDRGRDGDRDRSKDLDRDRERGRDLDRGRDRDRERYHRERDRERDRARDRDSTHDRGRDWDHDHDRDYGSHVDERSSRYKEDRSRRRSPDEYDDNYYNDKSRSVKADADRERSVTHRTHATNAVAGSSRGRLSPSSKSHIYADKYRDSMPDDTKYGDLRENASFPETPEKSSKYSDKHSKYDDYRIQDPSAERSPGTKASPLVRIDKSPSTSIDRKYVKRSTRRQSLDVDEVDRRSSGSNDVRDGSVNDDRQSRDMTSKKSLGEDYSSVESSFHHKPVQGNGPSFGHGPHGPNYRVGADSPSFMGSMGEDSRGPLSSRYRRSVDPNVGRAHGTPWKGIPNWASPISNGFMPFPPGPQGPPPHGGFPGMLPQFPSPIFGVRPPMDMNHSAIPYNLPDPDRFPGHMRPLGWPNMVDGLGPSHFHGWDGNNSLFRDEPPFYGPGNLPNGRPRESVIEPWKQNSGMMSVGATFGSRKDVHVLKPSIDEAQVAQGAQESMNESSRQEEMEKVDKSETPSDTLKKEILADVDKTAIEKTVELAAVDNGGNYMRAYLSKLDISIDLIDPELYNECINFADSNQIEDAVEDKTEKEEVLDPGILDANTDMKLLPVAEVSLFQRALNLYSTQSSVRRSSRTSKTNRLNVANQSSPSSEVKNTEQVVQPLEMVEVPYCKSDGTQASSTLVNILPATGAENEQIVLTRAEDTSAAPDMMAVPVTSEKSKVELEDCIYENPYADLAAHDDSVTKLDMNNNDTEMADVEEWKGKLEREEPLAHCAEEKQLLGSSKVSGPLILSHGSSVINKVYQASVPPNESELVNFTRIDQNPPGSTH